MACLAIIALGSGRAIADPLWQAEVRAGYGIAMGGRGDRMSTRPTPLTLAAIAAFAFNVDPPLMGYGGLLVETLDRNSVGSTFGVRLALPGSRLRLSAGGVWLFAPSMLLGATAGGGTCRQLGSRVGLCGELQLTAYFAGDDLAPGRTVTQAELVIGVVFDAL